MERHHDRQGGVERAAAQVAHLQTGHGRSAIGLCTEAQHTGDRRVVEIVAGTITIWSILTVTADAAEHELRIPFVQGAEADPEAIHDPRPEALHDHVRAVDEMEKYLTSQGVLEIDRQRPLVAVDGVEHRGAALDEGRHPAHVVAAGGVLDLDDVGAEIRQQHRAERPWKQPAEVEDSHIVECRHGRASVAIA